MREYDSEKPILPVCLCISTNTAMENDVYAGTLSNGEPMSRISIVKMGIQAILDRCVDPARPYRLALSILIFDNTVSRVWDFVLIGERNRKAPTIQPDKPYTVVGEALLRSMQQIREFEMKCDMEGTGHLPAVLMFLYAGKRNNGTQENLERARTEFRRMTEAGMKTAMLAITPTANMEILRSAAPEARVERVETHKLPELMPALVHAMGMESGGKKAEKPRPQKERETKAADPVAYVMDIWDL